MFIWHLTFDSTSTVIRTFIEEFVSSKEAPPWSSVVGLEDEFQTLMNRQDRFRKFISAQSSYKVHGVVHIDCKHVHVIKQTPTNNHSKSHYITYQQSLQVTLHHLPTITPSHTTSPTNNHFKSHYITYQQALQVTLRHLPTITPSYTTSPTNSHSKSHYITYQQALQVTLRHLPTITPSHTTSPTNNHTTSYCHSA